MVTDSVRLFFEIFDKTQAQKTQYFDQTQGNLPKAQAKFPKKFPSKARNRLKISLKTQGNLPKTQFWEILLEFWPNFLEFGQNIEFLAP